MNWADIILSVLGLAFAIYLIIAIEFGSRQRAALIERLFKFENRFNEMDETANRIASTLEKIEAHTERAVQSQYEADKWDRLNP